MKINDIELLELASKAAGIELQWSSVPGVSPRNSSDWNIWNPLLDDGDCARMEASLQIDVTWYLDRVESNVRQVENYGPALACGHEFFDEHGDDRQAARRFASLKVAADIGKAMK